MDHSRRVVMTEREWTTVMAALNAVQIFTDPDGEMHAQVRATLDEIDRQVRQQIILDAKGDHE